MAEEKKDVFAEFEEEKEKIKKEAYGYAGKEDNENNTTSSADEGNDSDKDDSAPAPEDNSNEDNTPPAPSRAPDGESHAYDDLDLNQMGKPQQETSSGKASSKGNWPKAPEHKKSGKGGGGKDIMELIWNEFILGFYDWVIDTAVDTVLDFADWVLYKPFANNENKPDKSKESEKKTAFDLGDELIAKYSQNAQKGKELFEQAHGEILENINRNQAGMAPEWKIWKNEPPFFTKVLDLAQKAKENPNSPEAAKYARFIKAPEIMDSMFKKEILLRKMSVGLAAIDETLNADEKALPPKVSSELIVMKKALEKQKDPEKLKESLKKSIEAITPLLKIERPTDKVIAEKISNMVQVISDPTTDLEVLTRDIGKNLNEANEAIKKNKEMNPQTNIENSSKGYYEDLMSNIDKIQKTYANDPEKAKATVHDYMVSVTEAIKTAKTDTDSYLSANTLTSKPHKKKARESLKKATASINSFILEGGEIGGKPRSPEQAQSPLTGDKYKIFKAVKDYGLGA
ncbi:MAG: hypothetical protein J6C85_00400 [Alphaproteobacteria bacterium]|nr:hypothetical protein [Alphaproteobacteria bacterium]